MKIATFNINNINKRLANLLVWLRTAKPDVVCLQELKSTDEAFPTEAIKKAGYSAVFRGQKSWNGVAILVRVGEPVLTRAALPGDATDTQSRYIEAAVNGVLIGDPGSLRGPKLVLNQLQQCQPSYRSTVDPSSSG